MDIETYQGYDGIGLAELIKKKEISPQECLVLAIDTIEKENPALNAVHVKDYERAREQADQVDLNAPFAGVPFLIKDMTVFYNGLPTSCGSRLLSKQIWRHDSEIITRYRNAGLIIVGKTNVPEFGLSPSSENEMFGDTHNPWDLAHSAGGSSAGAAAAVASGMVPMAHGSDGGGSLRIPASCCGLFGFKPSRGRMPTGPDYGRLWQGLATDHALTRSVRDSAALLDISSGPDLGAPLYAPMPKKPFLKAIESPAKPLRIAFSTKPFFPSDNDPACIHAVEMAAKYCESLGHDVVEADLTISSEQVLTAARTVMSSELATAILTISDKLKHRLSRGDLELTTHVFYQYGRKHRATDFLKATQTFELLTRQVAAFFVDYDVLITPTLARLPIKLHELKPNDWESKILRALSFLSNKTLLEFAITKDMRNIMRYMPYTLLFNITGQPAMSCPLSYAKGLPVGVQFVGGYGEDAMLLQLAHEIEQAHPWFDNRP